jgi:hypothetical protein
MYTNNSEWFHASPRDFTAMVGLVFYSLPYAKTEKETYQHYRAGNRILREIDGFLRLHRVTREEFYRLMINDKWRAYSEILSLPIGQWRNQPLIYSK